MNVSVWWVVVGFAVGFAVGAVAAKWFVLYALRLAREAMEKGVS